MRPISRRATLLGGGAALVGGRAAAQSGPLEITVSGAEIEPIPIAIVSFESAGGELSQTAAEVNQIVEANLEGCGLFRLISPAAFIDRTVPFDTVPTFANWRTIGAEALVTGAVLRAPDGRLQVQFRVFDTLAEEQLEGTRFVADPTSARRTAHKVSDRIYTTLTGEGPYFDSQIVFVDETGSKGNRRKRLALMDQDGANLVYLPGADGLVLTPRMSPDNRRVLYLDYADGTPEVFLYDIGAQRRERLGNFPGMSFAPRFSPNGAEAVLSLSQGGNTELYALTLATRQLRRLSSSPGIDTAASYSPDGSELVFESDRGGGQQIYIMPAGGGPARRISFGQGNDGTPVWSPRGDLIAFTKIRGGRFHIGVMRTDGSGERLLTTSFLDEGPTFAPNGRVLAFYRETPGAKGRASALSVDVTGRNIRPLRTPNAASDPSWGALRE